MKNLLFAVLAFSIGFAAIADPRIEEECHVPFVAYNTDIEVKFQNCQGDILSIADTLAHGTFVHEVELEPPAVGYPIHPLVQIKGDALSLDGYDDYTVAPDSACTMVTRNWDNANQQYNYTQFTTNDWFLQIKAETKLKDNGEYKHERRYTLMCFNGTQ